MAGAGNLHLWYSALAAEFGVVIRTDNAELLRQQLYRERKSVSDPELNDISCVIRAEDEIWLVKRYATVERTPTESND